MMLNTNSWFTSPQPRLALETAREEPEPPCCAAARLDIAEDFPNPPLPTEVFVPAPDPPEQVMKPPYPLARRKDPVPKPRLTPEQRSVELARLYEGQLSNSSLCKDLPRFRNAGGGNNNCADFVSSILQDTGRLKGHPVGVPELEGALRTQGWRPVRAGQTQPGDVWISREPTWHTELVTEPGATSMIGSNNQGRSYQTIKEHRFSGNRGTFYTHRPR